MTSRARIAGASLLIAAGLAGIVRAAEPGKVQEEKRFEKEITVKVKMNYLLFRAGTPPSGGFYLVKSMPKKGQVNVYIEVEEIDTTLAAIRKARGKVLVKKTPVGTMGWMAQFATPDGCFLSLWQAAPRSPEAEEGTPVP